MSKYELLQDLPSYRKGTIFERDPELRHGWQLWKDISTDTSTGGYAETIPTYMALFLDSNHDHPKWFKPLEQKEWVVEIQDADGGGDNAIDIWWNNKEQAEALRACIEVLMQHLDDDITLDENFRLHSAILKARKVFGGSDEL